MFLYLFIILTIGSVQSLTIGYPLRSFLAYDPAKTTAAQGFLIYIDNSGIERIVGFNYAEPVYAIHQISYINRETHMPQTFAQAEFNEVVKAQEAHFRAWSLQQYQVLKREIDLLRGEGKEPSAEMLLKFIPLEKIALTSDYSKIAELPEIKRIREDHLNIWKQVPQWDEDQIKENIKFHIENPNTSSVDIKETLVQKLENEGNLDTLSKKITELNKLQLQQQYAPDANTKPIILQSLNIDKSLVDQLNNTKAEDELKDLKPEARFAIKFSSESEIARDLSSIPPIKLQPEETKSNSTPTKLVRETNQESNVEKKIPSDIEKVLPSVSSLVKDNLGVTIETEQKHQIFEETNKKDLAEFPLKPTNDQTFVSVQPLQVLDTPEVVKAREEHLTLVMKAKQNINGQKKIQSELEKLIYAAPNIYVPQQVVDTAEVMRARDEHLRIVKEAIQKVKHAQGEEQKNVATEPTIALNGTEVEKVEVTTKAEADLKI